MSRAIEILETSEHLMRSQGYHAVSFRDIASRLGIKSASLHYHFPTKEDLGRSLVERYEERFDNMLADKLSGITDPRQQLALFIETYKEALHQAGQVCLCIMFSAELPALPESVRIAVQDFLNGHVHWIDTQFRALGLDPAQARQQALTVMAKLQGAMLLSVSCKDLTIFDRIAADMVAEIETQSS